MAAWPSDTPDVPAVEFGATIVDEAPATEVAEALAPAPEVEVALTGDEVAPGACAAAPRAPLIGIVRGRAVAPVLAMTSLSTYRMPPVGGMRWARDVALS